MLDTSDRSLGEVCRRLLAAGDALRTTQERMVAGDAPPAQLRAASQAEREAVDALLDRAELPGRTDLGALRLRTIATKDRACADFPGRVEGGGYDPAVILELDYWALMPR